MADANWQMAYERWTGAVSSVLSTVICHLPSAHVDHTPGSCGGHRFRSTHRHSPLS